MAGLPKSKKLQREESEAAETDRKRKLEEDRIDAETQVLPIAAPLPQKTTVKIKPFVCYNEWLVLIPLTRETALHLPAALMLDDKAIVAGVAENSKFNIGDTVIYQDRSVVKRVAMQMEPYNGCELILISERNVFMKLDPVPHEIVSGDKSTIGP